MLAVESGRSMVVTGAAAGTCVCAQKESKDKDEEFIREARRKRRLIGSQYMKMN